MTNSLDYWPDGDTRHLFADRVGSTVCHICCKERGSPDHITEANWVNLTYAYMRIAGVKL